MTMSEFETLLGRIDDVAAKVDDLARAFVVHCTAEETAKAVAVATDGKRSKWIDRGWTLGVCLAGAALGFLLKR